MHTKGIKEQAEGVLRTNSREGFSEPSHLVVGTTNPPAEFFLALLNVSAGAKIPIMPVEKSPPPYVVNRSLLRTEEVPRLVKGERRARDQRTATARDEHPSDQPVDRSEEHTSELQSLAYLVCRLLLEKKKKIEKRNTNKRITRHS